MNISTAIPLVLGLVLFSFIIHSVIIVPFINLLYKLHFIRLKEAPKTGKVPLIDKFLDKKAGVPTGGGILLVLLTTVLFICVFFFASRMGVFIHSAHNLNVEIFLIITTFIFFGVLGFADDYMKIFGKARRGMIGFLTGLSRRNKFILQWIIALAISSILYFSLHIDIIHIPLIDQVVKLGPAYIVFAAFIIVFFVNAFNLTDGLDGLSNGLLGIYLVAFAFITAGALDTPLSIFIAIWLGGILAFLYFNVWPARIILGDVGALAFGSMIALVGLLTGSVAPMFVIGGIFVVEAGSSAIQMAGWKFLKRAIFPLAPIHHAFLVWGWKEPKIVMRAWLAGIILAIVGLWMATI